MKKNNKRLFCDWICPAMCHTVCIYIFFILAFLVERAVFVFSFADSSIADERANVLAAFIAGFRFDTVVTLYALILFVLVSAVGIILKKRLNGIKTWLTTVLFVLFLILSIINFYYYKFFQENINILFFGLFEDDTQAVLTSVWTDYPLVFLLLMLAAASFIAFRIVRRIVSSEFRLPFRPALAVQILACALFFFLFISGIRGTYSMFPLKHEDKIICNNSFINKIAGNGAFDLKTAITLKTKQKIRPVDPDEIVKRYGFDSPADAVSLYLNRSVANEPDSIVAALTVRTPKDSALAANPPNVIVFMVESMSMYFMSLQDDKTFNLLGELKNELDGTFLFNHCLPSTGGTINTLEFLTINNCLSPVSQSSFYGRPYTAATAQPFYRAGYETCFFTSAHIGWRNINNFLSHQYFRNIAGAEVISGARPDSRFGSWGMFDEYLFDYTFDHLSNKPDSAPAFIFAMTVTNHSPYDMPDIVYDDLNSLPPSVEAQINTGSDIALKAFRTFRYTNDCLGHFIRKIKESPLADNTIIAITGDHNARGIVNYADSHKLQKYGVPLIFVLPDSYSRRPEMKTVDAGCFASHRDIFPTVYNLSLSEAEYIKSGVNLFSEEARNNSALCEFSILFDSNGSQSLSGGDNSYMNWTSDKKLELRPTDRSPLFEEARRRGNSYLASMAYLMELDLRKGGR